jgi:hypothetical protein
VFLSLDHIDGGGNKHRKELFGDKGESGLSLYRWAKNNGYPPIFQVLCMNCNHAKHVLGVCPHQKSRTRKESNRQPRKTKTEDAGEGQGMLF